MVSNSPRWSQTAPKCLKFSQKAQMILNGHNEHRCKLFILVIHYLKVVLNQPEPRLRLPFPANIQLVQFLQDHTILTIFCLQMFLSRITLDNKMNGRTLMVTHFFNLQFSNISLKPSTEQLESFLSTDVKSELDKITKTLNLCKSVLKIVIFIAKG